MLDATVDWLIAGLIDGDYARDLFAEIRNRPARRAADTYLVNHVYIHNIRVA